MKKNKARLNGFILLEVLISLSILGVAMAIFWQSRINQNFFDKELHMKFSSERLQHDREILLDLKMSQKLSMFGYGQSLNEKINQ